MSEALPEGWTLATLGSVATLQRGFDLPTRLRRRGRVPVVSSSGVSGHHDQAAVTGPGVVTGRYGTIGEVFYEAGPFWPLNTTLWVSDFHGNDDRFVFYLLQRVDFATHSGKSGVPGVNRKDIHGEVVGLPAARAEQRAIAEALSDADASIAAVERLVAKKEAMKQGLLQQLLQGRLRLPGFEGPWIEASVATLAAVRKGQQLGRSQMISHGLVPVWNGGTAPSGFTTSSNVDGPAVTISEGGNSCGWVGRPQGRFWLGGHCYALEPTVAGHSVAFLFHALKAREAELMELRAGSGLPNIQKTRLLRFTLAVPTDGAEARAIADVCDDADSALAALRARLAKAEAVKGAMMQGLLTGRARLSARGAPAVPEDVAEAA